MDSAGAADRHPAGAQSADAQSADAQSAGAQSAGSPDGPQRRSFEERLQELETLAERLKDGEVPLAEAVELFERGMQLARGLGAELSRVERRIEIMINEPELTGDAPLLEPFADHGSPPRGRGQEEAPP